MRNSTRLLIHSLLWSSAVLSSFACSGSESATFDNTHDAATGGSGGTASGGSGGSSGNGGGAGSVGSGGTAGGGASGSAGASGKGGAGGSSGSAGTGGSTGGTAGAAGGTGATGGVGGATGGTSGTGGAAGGTGGAAGATGGSGGAGTGGTAGAATGGTAGKGGAAGKDGGLGKGGGAGSVGTGGNSGASGSGGKGGAAGSSIDGGGDQDGSVVDATPGDGANDARVDAGCPNVFGAYQINNADGTLCGDFDEDAPQEIRGTTQACFLSFLSVPDGGGAAVSGGASLGADGTFSGATLTLGTTPRMPCRGTWDEQEQELTIVCGANNDTCSVELLRTGP
jgi:hypothetical protein